MNDLPIVETVNSWLEQLESSNIDVLRSLEQRDDVHQYVWLFGLVYVSNMVACPSGINYLRIAQTEEVGIMFKVYFSLSSLA